MSQVIIYFRLGFCFLNTLFLGLPQRKTMTGHSYSFNQNVLLVIKKNCIAVIFYFTSVIPVFFQLYVYLFFFFNCTVNLN